MTKQQDIVPVQLKDDYKKQHNFGSNKNPQKLVARLKSADSELFIYESIHESTLKVLLTELYTNETY